VIHESRRAPRRRVSENVPLVDTMTDQVVGYLGNLSETGMLLMAHAPLCEDALYQLRFDLGQAGEPLPVLVGAHLLWIGPANTPGQSWCGFRFLTIAEEQRAAVRAWVQAGNPPS
jgi:hypothetical protein